MPARKKKVAAGSVVGVFETRERAERAIAELRRNGFTDDQIGLIARNSDGSAVRTDADGEDTFAEEGAVAGAIAGAGAGALVGAGVLAGVIPVIGPVLAVGALGTILLNAAGGAAIAGLAGALIGWGIPEEDAEYYEGEVKSGRFLVTVTAAGREAEARRILYTFGGFDRTGWNAVQVDRNLRTETATAEAGAARSADGGRTVQLREERLNVEKTPVQTGEVEVRKEVHTEHKTVTVPVEREEIVIERRPVNRPTTAADLHASMGAEGELRIPVKEERVNVEKQTVVKEEVAVGKRKVHDTKTVSAELKEEELVVESEGETRIHTDTEAAGRGRRTRK